MSIGGFFRFGVDEMKGSVFRTQRNKDKMGGLTYTRTKRWYRIFR